MRLGSRHQLWQMAVDAGLAAAAWYLAFWPTLWNSTQSTNDDVVVRFVFDIMTYDAKFERRWADRNAAEMQRCMDKASMVAQIVDNNGPFWPNQSHFLCDERWCDHWIRCPFGAGQNVTTDPTPVLVNVGRRVIDIEAIDPE